jgi:hypothetical protein
MIKAREQNSIIIILTIIIIISLHRDFSPLVNTPPVFASSPTPTITGQ